MMSEEQCITASMKKGIKENPTTRKYLHEMIADGINEDVALNIMILAWFQYGIKREKIDKVIDDE